MAHLLEPKEADVTIINRVTNFGSEINFRLFQYCVTRFRFPGSPASNWILDYSLRNETSSQFFVYLTRNFDEPDEVVELSGTFSVITANGSSYVLGIFLHEEFKNHELKEVKLKELDTASDDCMELFPNNILTLRCHLWKTSSHLRQGIIYRTLTLTYLEKHYFKWTIEGERNEDGKVTFGTYYKEIPVNIIGQKNYVLHTNMKIEDILRPDTVYRLSFLQSNEIALFICPKITLQSKCGQLAFIQPTNCNQNLYFLLIQSIPIKIPCIFKELKERESVWGSDRIFDFSCEIKCISDCKLVIESIDLYEKEEYIFKEKDISNEISKFIDNKHCSQDYETLQDALYSFHKNGNFSDVILRADNKEFSCHKAILSARSTVFRAMFENDMLEKNSNVITVSEESRILALCLTFLYTDRTGKLNWEDACKLFAVADKYAILPLKKRCTIFFKHNLSTSNVCEVLILAYMHNDLEMKSIAESCIVHNAKTILNTDEWKALKANYQVLAFDIMDKLIENVYEL